MKMSDEPLIKHVFTADPSAHVFEGKLYIYPSHDIATDIQDNDNGDQYAMEDYHVFSLSKIGGEVTDHGAVLSTSQVPWVSKQMWAPDAASKNGKYYLYFPARDKSNVFRIGVAVGPTPSGPFVAQPEPIKGSFSIDPAAFVDDDGEAYLYFGGIWGGQLQCWAKGEYREEEYEVDGEKEPKTGTALLPRVARLTDDMLEFKSEVTELQILAPETGELLAADDHDRRFFEAAWMHKYKGTYYFSYSTGDTHYLCYATGKSPLGPFTYGGRILEPVLGWTTHHSICEFQGRWWLFHHDTTLSGGKNHLRCVKMKEIFYDEEGRILPVKVA